MKQLHDAMFTPTNGDRKNAPNKLIVITDREGDLEEAVQESEVAKEKGVDVTAVAVGDQVDIIYEVPNN